MKGHIADYQFIYLLGIHMQNTVQFNSTFIIYVIICKLKHQIHNKVYLKRNVCMNRLQQKNNLQLQLQLHR